jgi:hypothetical protein
MSAEMGRHLQTRWVNNGTLAGGWTYQGSGYWGTPAPPRPNPARMIELAEELVGRFPQLGFAGNVVRLWCWGEWPIVLPT